MKSEFKLGTIVRLARFLAIFRAGYFFFAGAIFSEESLSLLPLDEDPEPEEEDEEPLLLLSFPLLLL